MTIASTTTKQAMLGDGTTRSWPFTFRAWMDEVRVIVADAAGLETDVTALSRISLKANGGTVVYPADPKTPALPPGHRIVIMRAMDFVQETRLINVTRFDPTVIEDQLDRLIANDQQLQEQVDRALTVNVTSDRDPATVIEEVFQARDRAEHAATSAGNSEDAATASAQAAAESATAAGVSAQQAEAWAQDAKDASTQGPTATPAQKGLVPAGGTAGQVYRVNAAGNAYGWEALPKVEFATSTETVSGIENAKATTPAGVKTAIDAAVAAIPAGFPSGGIVMWSGTVADIPAGWVLCDGQNGTPNLQERFVLGGGTFVPHSIGGSYKTGATTLTVAQMPGHSHQVSAVGTYDPRWGSSLASEGGLRLQTLSTAGQGGNQPHDHDLIPPYYVLCYIMKQ